LLFGQNLHAFLNKNFPEKKACLAEKPQSARETGSGNRMGARLLPQTKKSESTPILNLLY